jgi:hypothetical protein
MTYSRRLRERFRQLSRQRGFLLNPFRFGGGSIRRGDPYINNVVFLSHMDGANASTQFTDVIGHALTAVGNAQISTAQARSNDASALFDGAGDGITSPAHANWEFGAGDFTIEVSVYRSAQNNTDYKGIVISDNTSSTRGWLLHATSSAESPSYGLGFACNTNLGSFVLQEAIALPMNQWHDIIVCRKGATLFMVRNGVLVASTNIGAAVLNTANAPLTIGALYTSAAGGVNASTSWPGHIDEIRITKGVARYDSAQGSFQYPALPFPDPITTDPYFPDVSLLLHMDGTDGTAAFTDSSNTTGIAPTVNGTVALSKAKYKFGGTSAAFPGTNGSYLSYASNAVFGFSTAIDFTIEGFIYLTGALGVDRAIADMRVQNGAQTLGCTFFIDGTTNKLAVWNSTVKVGSTGTALVLNQWYHVVLTRQGNTIRCFLNGVLDFSTTTACDFLTSAPLGIGACPAANLIGTSPFSGYMDELRITKGLARYTANFTVPTAPYGEGSFKVKVLSLSPVGYYRFEEAAGTAVTDFSGNANDGSYVGGALPAAPGLLPGNEGSLAFTDAAAKYATVPAAVLNKTSVFSISFIVQYTTTTNLVILERNTNGFSVEIGNGTLPGSVAGGLVLGTDSISLSLATTKAFNDGQPHHVLLVVGVDLANSYFFVDGADVTNRLKAISPTYSSTTVVTVGSRAGTLGFGGRLDELAFFNSALTAADALALATAALYQTAFLMHMDGADTSTTFTDALGLTAWTPSGNAQLSIAQSKFGGAAYKGDGTGDCITTPDLPVLRMGTFDFTFECFLYRVGGAVFQGLCTKRSANSQFSEFAVYLGTDDKLNFTASINGASWSIALTGTTVVTANAWHHVACTRKGSTFTIWLDGVSVATGTLAGALFATTNPFSLGALSSIAEFSLNGYLDEVRLTKGVARYTAAFTPPAAPFTS